MKLALEALEKLNNTKSYWWQEVDDDVTDQLLNAETALQEALAQPQQEPTCKHDLQVWVQRTGQFSWEPQDERFWTRMQPAQPQQEPVAWAIFTDAGNARMWSTFQPHLQKLADAEGLTITPLYTKDQI